MDGKSDGSSSSENSLVNLPTKLEIVKTDTFKHKKKSYLPNYGSEDENEEDCDDTVQTQPWVRVLTDATPLADEQKVERTVSVEYVHVELPLKDPHLGSSSLDSDGDSLYKPTDLYEFKWREFPRPPVPPKLRRETFKDSTPGPKDHYSDPYAAFTAIWDKDIMAQICMQTNMYVQQSTYRLMMAGSLRPQSRIRFWQDIDENELYVYFAIVLAMGIVIKSRLEEYWSRRGTDDIFATPGFSATMTFQRFQLISQWLHFNNNANMNHDVTSSQAKLFKIQPVVDHLNQKFSTLYSLGQNVVLDESLTQWQGWLGINPYIPIKATRVGIKTYEVCEPRTGYLWRFEVHTGSEPHQDSDPVLGTIPSIVLRLVQGLEYKGHTLWMDDHYNSPAFARRLKSLNFDCVGTLRTNQQFVPAQLATLQNTDLARGQLAGCSSGDVDLLVWRDRNIVGLISTYHGTATSRSGDTLKPTIVHDYNVCMGSVDKKDKMLAQYPIERKRTRVWYKKFFRRLLNVSVLNAYIMFRHKHPTMEHRHFRLILTGQLLERHRLRPTVPAGPSPSRHKFSKEMLNHLPAERGLLPGSRGRLQRVCVVCKKRTHTYCPGCDVALCTFRRNLTGDRSDRDNTHSCFYIHHS